MSDCNQDTITDHAFSHLSSIETLNLKGCSQRSITDEALLNLSKFTSLKMIDILFTDKGLVYLTQSVTIQIKDDDHR
jgi:hypothetical protein